MSLLPKARNTWTPTSSAFPLSVCPIITLRHYCTLLFTENTDRAFQCSFSKLNHSFFFFLAQRNVTDGPQDQSENHNIYQPSLVQGQPQDSDRQRCHRLEEINKVQIHLTVKTRSPPGKGGQEGAVFSAPRSGGQWVLGSRSRMGRDKHHS